MKVYLIKRNNDINYDETDSMVIVAKSETEARQIASTANWGDYRYNDKDIDVEHIKLTGKARIILDSFIAG